MTLKPAELLVLALLLTRKRRVAPAPQPSGEWEPPAGVDPLPVIPLPPNPLGH